jgi:glycosyltransferase involved in cell wall biosynthesis
MMRISLWSIRRPGGETSIATVFCALGGGIQLLRDVVRLGSALRSSRFDVIHLTTSGHLAAVRDLAVSYVANLFGVPLVYHIRFGRIPAIAKAGALEWRLIRKVMERAASVITIDAATFAAVQAHAPKASVCLIPNCVNVAELPTAQSTASDQKIALFLGWVVPTKGIGELADAWSRLKPLGWKLDIVGPVDEAYRSHLQAQFSLDTVSFHGQLSHREAMERMADCDLFILPSYTEGFPNVVVEAMALGKPIIATAVGAIPEMLEGGAGILVESRSAEQLGAAIQRVINDLALRKQLGERAQEKAMNKYTIDVVFGAYVSLWNRVSNLEAISK